MHRSLAPSQVNDSSPAHPSEQPACDYPRKRLRFAEDWDCRVGDLVEIRKGHAVVRRGVVEAAMPNGSGLWLAAHGVSSRVYYHKDIGMELWICE